MLSFAKQPEAAPNMNNESSFYAFESSEASSEQEAELQMSNGQGSRHPVSNYT